MIVAIDKNSINQIKDPNEYEYIYIFEHETLDELLKTKVHCMKEDLVDEVDINLTDYNISCLKKAKITDKDWYVKPKVKENKIAIIMPNYNYEECLEQSIGSILKQTYTNYEIIFIDDMSTDNSVNKARQLLRDKDKIVELKQKRYNGGARNEAYLHISDDVDYIMYVDSDDWLINENVLTKINRKLQTRPDVLFIGIASYQGRKEIDCFKPSYTSKYEAIKGWSGSCGKVIKKELATKQECLYAEGTLKEDRNQHCRICINMNSFECMQDCVYVWNRTNTKSVTTIRNNLWKTSTIRHYADTLQLYLENENKDKKIADYLNDRVKKTKREMEIGGDAQW